MGWIPSIKISLYGLVVCFVQVIFWVQSFSFRFISGYCGWILTSVCFKFSFSFCLRPSSRPTLSSSLFSFLLGCQHSFVLSSLCEVKVAIVLFSYSSFRLHRCSLMAIAFSAFLLSVPCGPELRCFCFLCIHPSLLHSCLPGRVSLWESSSSQATSALPVPFPAFPHDAFFSALPAWIARFEAKPDLCDTMIISFLDYLSFHELFIGWSIFSFPARRSFMTLAFFSFGSILSFLFFFLLHSCLPGCSATQFFLSWILLFLQMTRLPIFSFPSPGSLMTIVLFLSVGCCLLSPLDARMTSPVNPYWTGNILAHFSLLLLLSFLFISCVSLSLCVCVFAGLSVVMGIATLGLSGPFDLSPIFILCSLPFDLITLLVSRVCSALILVVPIFVFLACCCGWMCSRVLLRARSAFVSFSCFPPFFISSHFMSFYESFLNCSCFLVMVDGWMDGCDHKCCFLVIVIFSAVVLGYLLFSILVLACCFGWMCSQVLSRGRSAFVSPSRFMESGR